MVSRLNKYIASFVVVLILLPKSPHQLFSRYETPWRFLSYPVCFIYFFHLIRVADREIVSCCFSPTNIILLFCVERMICGAPLVKMRLTCLLRGTLHWRRQVLSTLFSIFSCGGLCPVENVWSMSR